MAITFKKITGETEYLDPNNGFELTRVPFEIRIDTLTQTTGRIVRFEGFQPDLPDLEALLKKSRQIGCPFCAETLETQAARFPSGMISGGRIRKGKATVIPNIVPFDMHPAICLFSDDHHLPLTGFTPQLLGDALLACQDFFRKAAATTAEHLYLSINWNYMPPAGSSLVHPHLQPVAGKTPTNTQREIFRATHEYVTLYLTHYWRDLIRTEEERGERYIGRVGRVVWLSPFVPTGLYPDVMAVFCERHDILELEEQNIAEFSLGLAKILTFYDSLGIYSLNLSIFSGLKGDSTVWVHARITPRTFPRPIGNSDITYFGMLHKEPISIMAPEEFVSRLRPQFSR